MSTPKSVIAVLGLPKQFPRDVSLAIGKIAERMRTRDILHEVIGILEEMQSSRDYYGSSNLEKQTRRIKDITDILQEITNKFILEYPIELVTYGGRGHKYVTTWSIRPPNPSPAAIHRGMQDRELAHIDGFHSWKTITPLSMRGWDGTIPGDRSTDPYSRPSEGWFVGQITFIKKLIEYIKYI